MRDSFRANSKKIPDFPTAFGHQTPPTSWRGSCRGRCSAERPKAIPRLSEKPAPNNDVKHGSETNFELAFRGTPLTCSRESASTACDGMSERRLNIPAESSSARRSSSFVQCNNVFETDTPAFV